MKKRGKIKENEAVLFLEHSGIFFFVPKRVIGKCWNSIYCVFKLANENDDVLELDNERIAIIELILVNVER